MGGGAIFGITFLALVITLLLATLLLLFLNKYQVINLYIPRKLRVFFIKRFITPEQESAYLAEEATVGAIDETKRLQYALTLAAGGHGHKLDDSLFANQSDEAGYADNDFNPNRMFEVHG